MVTIKKYSNRRLYDTSESQYMTLEELAKKIRSGVDVKVIDAKTDEDLTQAILAQIIMESRGASRLLPARMLMQLIRMEDDALAEFFGQYMSYALEFYQRVTLGARSVGSFGAGPASGAGIPGAGMFGAPNPFAQWMGQMYGGGWPGAFGGQVNPMSQGGYAAQTRQAPAEREPEPPAAHEPAPAPEDAPKPAASGEVAQMRQELEELKELIKMAALGKIGGE